MRTVIIKGDNAFIMKNSAPLTNIEESQKLDRTLLERLAKAVADLPDIEE